MTATAMGDGQASASSSTFDSLIQVSFLASNSLDLDEVLPKTLAGIAELLPADRLTLLQENGGHVAVRASWGDLTSTTAVQWNQIYSKAAFPALCPREAERVDERVPGEGHLQKQLPYLVTREPVQALLVPLTIDSVTIGRLDIVRTGGKPPFTAWEQRCAEACGKILSLAVRNGMEYARVAWLAEHDPLTGIGNRRRFDVALSRELSRAQRYERALTLVLIDLDDFKEVNTHLGLSGGDEILRRMANVLASGARHGVDVPCRIGGDEFALILPEISESAAHELVQRLLKEVVKATAPLWPMRFSFSISTFPATTAEDLRRSADARLLAAKTRKRQSVGPDLKLVQ